MSGEGKQCFIAGRGKEQTGDNHLTRPKARDETSGENIGAHDGDGDGKEGQASRKCRVGLRGLEEETEQQEHRVSRHVGRQHVRVHPDHALVHRGRETGILWVLGGS